MMIICTAEIVDIRDLENIETMIVSVKRMTATEKKIADVIEILMTTTVIAKTMTRR